MRFRLTSLSALALVVPGSLAMAETPKRLSQDERVQIERQAAPMGDQFKRLAADAPERLKQDLERSNGANGTVRAFLAQAALTTITVQDAPVAAPASESAPADASVAATKPLEVKPGPKDTVIAADDGMFFDAEAGLLVYLKNVRLTSPDFDLSGANELKVFLGKKEEKKKEPAKDGQPAPEPAKEEKNAAPGILGASGGFGDPEKIIATGAVKITQKSVDGKAPVVASAAVLTYDAKTGEIILNGGYPWVQQGSTFMRAMEPNLYLRIKKDGSFVTEGRWDMGGQLNAAPGAKPAPNPGAAKPGNR